MLAQKFNAVERILEYADNIELETDVVQMPEFSETGFDGSKCGNNEGTEWPEKGRICFENFQMRYRPELEPVGRRYLCTFKQLMSYCV